MPRRKDNLPSFNAVGAAQTATVNLPVNRRYHAIFIEYKGTANQTTIEADITEVRILVDGNVQRRFSASDLNSVNAFNGYAFKAGLLPIFFSEPWRRDAFGEDMLSWGMYGSGTFQIEIDIHADATAPALGGFYVFDNVPQSLSNIMKWRKQTLGVTSTGQRSMNTLPKKDVYHRIHCFETAADDIADVSIEIDGLNVYDMEDSQNDALLEVRDFVPQSDVYHIVFDETQRVQDGLPMTKPDGTQVGEFNIDFNFAVANDATLLIETRGNPD